MPWKIAKNSDSGKWCVHKETADSGLGEQVACHDSEAEAKQQMAALYAGEPAARAIRMVDGSDDMLEGVGMPFGGIFSGQDLYGEHFSIKTDFAFPWFSERPALFHHGLDSDAGIAVVGRVKAHEVRADLGVWTKVQLDKSSEYFAAIKDLVRQGKLFFSSGAMAHLVDVDKRSGEIKRWPWVELSLTPTPANLLATVDFATASRHYKSAGLELPDGLNAVSMAMMRQMAADMDVEMSDAEMQQMVAAHPDADEAEMRKLMQKRKAGAMPKAVSKAMSKERMQQMCKEMGVSMSDEDMEAMMESDMSEDDMRKKLLAKKPAKSADHSTYVAWRGQGLLATKQVNEDAFWSHVTKGEGDNAHWIWTGAKNTKGYGILEVDGETVRAHRVAYEMAHGPIPDGKDVGHKTSCATTSCVRAAHLELVTNDENAQERANRKAAPSFSDFVSFLLDDPGLDVEPVPIGFHAETVTHLAASLAQRTKGLTERRLKEGRMISDANRKRLMGCMEQMGAAMREMQTLLDSSMPTPKGTEGRTADMAMLRRQADSLRLFAATLPQN